MERDGQKAGDGLHKGMSGGLSKLANLISNTGLPLGGLSTGGLEKAGKAAQDADKHSSGPILGARSSRRRGAGRGGRRRDRGRMWA
jgi:hypothetical protein